MTMFYLALIEADWILIFDVQIGEAFGQSRKSPSYGFSKIFRILIDNKFSSRMNVHGLKRFQNISP